MVATFISTPNIHANVDLEAFDYLKQPIKS